jgi:hypothetical protein
VPESNTTAALRKSWLVLGDDFRTRLIPRGVMIPRCRRVLIAADALVDDRPATFAP